MAGDKDTSSTSTNSADNSLLHRAEEYAAHLVEEIKEEAKHIMEEVAAVAGHEAEAEIDDVVGDAEEENLIHAVEEATPHIKSAAAELVHAVGEADEKQLDDVFAVEPLMEALDKSGATAQLAHALAEEADHPLETENDPLGVDEVLNALTASHVTDGAAKELVHALSVEADQPLETEDDPMGVNDVLNAVDKMSPEIKKEVEHLEHVVADIIGHEADEEIDEVLGTGVGTEEEKQVLDAFQHVADDVKAEAKHIADVVTGHKDAAVASIATAAEPSTPPKRAPSPEPMIKAKWNSASPWKAWFGNK